MLIQFRLVRPVAADRNLSGSENDKVQEEVSELMGEVILEAGREERSARHCLPATRLRSCMSRLTISPGRAFELRGDLT
jgi:hypothetical protein